MGSSRDQNRKNWGGKNKREEEAKEEARKKQEKKVEKRKNDRGEKSSKGVGDLG